MCYSTAHASIIVHHCVNSRHIYHHNYHKTLEFVKTQKVTRLIYLNTINLQFTHLAGPAENSRTVCRSNITVRMKMRSKQMQLF